MKIKGAIFDIDGTLLNSNDAHVKAYQQALEESGLSYPYLQIRRLIGMGGDHLLPKLTGISEESEEGMKISKRKKEIFNQEYLSHLRPFPKAKELVHALHKKGILIAIATSAKQEELDRFLHIIGITNLVISKASSDDVGRSKPDPDIILAALKTLKLPSDQVLMIGDTPYDMEAAKKANVKAIALRSGGWSDADLRYASSIFQNTEDFLAHLNESPFFQKSLDHQSDRATG